MATPKFEKDLLKFLTKLSSEKVELDDDVMTRAEALARTVWKEALGYSVYADEAQEDGSITKVFRQYHAPDKAARAVLFDYLLGKPKPHTASKKDEKKAREVPISRKISDALVAHLNQEGGVDAGGGRSDKTGAKNPISERMRNMALSKDRVGSTKAPGSKLEEAPGVDD